MEEGGGQYSGPARLVQHAAVGPRLLAPRELLAQQLLCARARVSDEPARRAGRLRSGSYTVALLAIK